MNGFDSQQPVPDRFLLPLTLEDIEAVCCGRDTPEQHARYVAAFNDPDSEFNAMLTHIRSSETNVLNQSLPYPSRSPKSKRNKRKPSRPDEISERPPSVLGDTLIPPAAAPSSFSIADNAHNHDSAHTIPIHIDVPRTELTDDNPNSERNPRRNDPRETGKAVAWLPLLLRRGKSVTIIATVIVASVGVGFYFLSHPSIVSQVRDGQGGTQNVAVASDGTVTGLPELDSALRTSVIIALREQTIQVLVRLPLLPGMKGSDIPPLSESLVLEPYHTVVSSVQPVFRWKGTAKAKSYEVHVYDESKTLVEKSEILTAPLWTPLNTLQRGQTYLWDVLVTFDDGTTSLPKNEPQAVFRILSDEEFADYQAAVANLKGFHSALGTYFVQQGLLDEAQAEFDELLRLNPESTSIQSLVEKTHALRE